MDRTPNWPRRTSAAVIAAAALGAGLTAAGPAAQAAPGEAGRIQGGVEDGTFKACLNKNNKGTPEKVLNAVGFRGKLGDGLVRILVPWNIARTPGSPAFQCLDRYLIAAQGKANVEVSLNRTGTTADYPSVANYTNAVNALAAREGPRIAYLTAYNEPNNKHYMNQKGHHPASRSGHFYLIANKAFPGKVVAGDFASGVSKGFLNGYIRALGKTRPKLWALHPYTDVSNFQYFMHRQPANHKNPQAAGQLAIKPSRSKVVEFARALHAHKYGPGTQLWINEIYVDHNSDKCAPWHPGKPCPKGTPFGEQNQGYAALFLAGALGPDSLPGALKGKRLPQLTRYVYLRANDAPKKARKKAAVMLKVHFRNCVYYTLAGHKATPAPQCGKG